VRARSEWEAGVIPGSVLCPWHDTGTIPADLDDARPIAVVCASGQRAGVAASLLARAGARHVIHVVDGGVPAWARLGHPVVPPSSPELSPPSAASSAAGAAA